MTEEEKYCGQGYVPKVNKGEAKQEQWIEVCMKYKEEIKLKERSLRLVS